jgi:hypothetical protein
MVKRLVFERERPPRVISICGQKVKIRVVAYLEDSNQELLGAFNAETKTIFLLRGANWRQTLLHEICHAVLYFSGASEGLTETKEESIVLALEHGLAPIVLGA